MQSISSDRVIIARPDGLEVLLQDPARPNRERAPADAGDRWAAPGVPSLVGCRRHRKHHDDAPREIACWLLVAAFWRLRLRGPNRAAPSALTRVEAAPNRPNSRSRPAVGGAESARALRREAGIGTAPGRPHRGDGRADTRGLPAHPAGPPARSCSISTTTSRWSPGRAEIAASYVLAPVPWPQSHGADSGNPSDEVSGCCSPSLDVNGLAPVRSQPLRAHPREARPNTVKTAGAEVGDALPSEEVVTQIVPLRSSSPGRGDAVQPFVPEQGSITAHRETESAILTTRRQIRGC